MKPLRKKCQLRRCRIYFEPTVGLQAQEHRLRLKRPTPNAARRCPPTSEVIRQVEEEEEFLFARA
jgi:hypothetical protein